MYITCSILSLTNELQFASAHRVKTTWFRYFYCVISIVYISCILYIVHDKHYLYLCSYSYPYLYEFILFRFAFVIGFLMTNLMMKFMLFRFSVCINYHLISLNETCATISWLPCLLRSVCLSVCCMARKKIIKENLCRFFLIFIVHSYVYSHFFGHCSFMCPSVRPSVHCSGS